MAKLAVKLYVYISFVIIAYLYSYRPISILQEYLNGGYPYADYGKWALLFCCFVNFLLIFLFYGGRKFNIFRVRKTFLIFILFCGLVLYLVVSGLWRPAHLYVFEVLGLAGLHLSMFLFSVSLVVVVVYFWKAKTPHFFADLFLVFSILATFSSLPSLLFNGFSVRGISFLGDSTTFGSVCAIGVLSLFYKYSFGGVSRPVFLVILIWLATFIVYAGSRNAMLSLFLSLIFFRYPFMVNKTYMAILVLPIAIIFLFYCESSILIESVPVGVANEHSRLYIWSHSWLLFSNGDLFDLILGKGFGFLRYNFRSSHNSYLQILIEFGLLFLMLFLLFVYFCLISLKSKMQLHSGYLYFLAVLIFCISFSFNIAVLLYPKFSVIVLVFYIAIGATLAPKFYARSL